MKEESLNLKENVLTVAKLDSSSVSSIAGCTYSQRKQGQVQYGQHMKDGIHDGQRKEIERSLH